MKALLHRGNCSTVLKTISEMFLLLDMFAPLEIGTILVIGTPLKWDYISSCFRAGNNSYSRNHQWHKCIVYETPGPTIYKSYWICSLSSFRNKANEKHVQAIKNVYSTEETQQDFVTTWWNTKTFHLFLCSWWCSGDGDLAVNLHHVWTPVCHAQPGKKCHIIKNQY